MKLLVQVLDSEGVVVCGETVYSTGNLAAGETFDDEKWVNGFTLAEGSYTLEVLNADYFTGERLTQLDIMPDPDRWYSTRCTTSGSLYSRLSDEQKDAVESIVSELSRLNVGVDDEFRLSGFSEEPVRYRRIP